MYTLYIYIYIYIYISLYIYINYISHNMLVFGCFKCVIACEKIEDVFLKTLGNLFRYKCPRLQYAVCSGLCRYVITTRHSDFAFIIRLPCNWLFSVSVAVINTLHSWAACTHRIHTLCALLALLCGRGVPVKIVMQLKGSITQFV